MKTINNSKNWIYILFILGQSVLYGIGNPITKIAYESMSVFWCLTLRFTLATLIFLLLFGKKIIEQLQAVNVWTYLPTSLCMAIAYISVNMALSYSPATIVGFIMSMPVVITPILSKIILKKRYEWRHVPLQVLIVIGLYLLCCGNNGVSFGIGEVYAIITAMALAAGMIFGEKSLSKLDSTFISCTQAAMTAFISIICVLLFEPRIAVVDIHISAWLVVIYLAVGCTCLAYFLQNKAIKVLASQKVSMLQTSQPIFTAFFAYLILGERLSMVGYVGAGIILVCLLVESLLHNIQGEIT